MKTIKTLTDKELAYVIQYALERKVSPSVIEVLKLEAFDRILVRL